MYTFSEVGAHGPFTVLHSFQKSLAAQDASLCTHPPRLNLRHTTGRAEVDRFRLFCAGLLLTVLLACLPAAAAATLSALSCSSTSMTKAGTDSCTVTLNAAAARGGFTVRLASNNSSVTVPASVTVAAGSTTASFTATVSSVSTAQTATLTASARQCGRKLSP